MNGGKDENQDVEDALAAFGLQVESLETQKTFEIWAENLEILNVFLACSDDWIYGANGKLKAINKLAIQAVMDMMEVSNKKQTFTYLLAMQDAVTEAFNG